MLKRGIFTRFEAWRNRDEEGIALASVVILSFVILVIAASLSATLVNAVNLTADNKSRVITFSSAESGIDAGLYKAVTLSAGESCTPEGSEDGFEYEIYRSAAEDAPTSLTDSSLSKGCPQDGDTFVAIVAKGTDARGEESEVFSAYRWVIRDLGSTEGAVVAGTGLSNISQLGVYNADGDLLIEEGNFDCNSSSNLSGDVIIMDGTFRMSGGCDIAGSVYASGNVIVDNAAVAIGGDVYTLGNFSMTTSAVIHGDVRAKGNLTIDSGARINGSVTGMGTGETKIDNATIGGSVSTAGTLNIKNNARINGSVISSSSGAADLYGARIDGDILINGRFQQFQSFTIGGNISAAASGQSSSISPGISTPGWIRLGGTIATWGSGPSAAQGVFTNQTIAPSLSPTFDVPDQLKPNFFKWRDYAYAEEDWTSAGYQVVTRNDCNFQDYPANVAAINSYTTPTVVDARACTDFKAYNVTFNLKTDVTFILNKMSNGEGIKINSAPGTGSHDFHLIIPDLVNDGSPTCSSGQGEMRIYGITMGTNISGFIYTPCMVTFGGPSVINGQIYTGHANYSAGGETDLNYLKMSVPGFPVESSTEAPTAFDIDAEERVLPVLVSRSES